MGEVKGKYVLCNINVMAAIGRIPPRTSFILFEMLKVMDEAGNVKITHANRERILKACGKDMSNRRQLCNYMYQNTRKLCEAGFLFKEGWSTYRVNPLFFKAIGTASKHAVNI